MDFKREFELLTSFRPLRWQSRLFAEYLARGILPAAVDIPTGLGKTAVIAIWYLALKAGAPLPRRLVYVVDRRAVVDQATSVADGIKEKSGDQALRVSTLRGQHVDAGDWLEDPTSPAIIVGTVDMVGSRLLFSGYGVSRKMRPYHAGLLGADTVVVLDESHLVPPFEKLLASIDADTPGLRAREENERLTVPPFKLMSLSATGRARGGTVFRLDESRGDLDDQVVGQRLAARKSITIVDADGKKLEDALASHAWSFLDHGNDALRVLVFCDERDVAKKVKDGLEKQSSTVKIEIETELFVGARRVKERMNVAERLGALGFIAGTDHEPQKPSFLIATSAGEVGVDLDADHMVCDVVTWERMVQRLGRVNRRGRGQAKVIVIRPPLKQKEQEALEKQDQNQKLSEKEQKLIEDLERWDRLVAPLRALPTVEGGLDGSPGALRDLKLRAEADSSLKKQIDDATSPMPLYPALSRALVDAWSMTSLEKHTGRPEVAPWLRGWIEDEAPQTAVVWRKHLPIRITGGEASTREVEEFFEAAPPHLSEKLETEHWRVAQWLIKRADALISSDAHQQVVAFVFSPAGQLQHQYRLNEIVACRDDKKREETLKDDLAGCTLIVDARLGGLSSGLLDDTADASEVSTADGGSEWPVDVGFRIRVSGGDDAGTSRSRITHVFVTKRSAEGEDIESLLVETQATEESRAASTHPQLLAEHQSWTEQKARRIAKAVGLKGDFAEALAIAARLHDEGKKAKRWQIAFNAPKDGYYAKTRGPLLKARLGRYRHEFGSLPYAERDEAFKRLPAKLQDLVLHLIAAHHGRARPTIETEGCEDAPPSVLESRARDIALRFARLQKQWGPWGLAWWEALLRAADQQASRENDKLGGGHG